MTPRKEVFSPGQIHPLHDCLCRGAVTWSAIYLPSFALLHTTMLPYGACVSVLYKITNVGLPPSRLGYQTSVLW